MANWGGTANIANATGTLTSADATTATNTGASWPTGGTGLASLHIRILSGPGASTTPVLIASNTSQIITISGSWPSGTPDNTSTYEIVLRLKNNDHITSSLLCGTNCIVECEDSATIYVDGNYNLKFADASTVVRLAKTEATMITFCANNRTTTGVIGSWGYVWPAANFTTPAQIQFIKIQDSQYGMPLTGQDLTGVHHIWVDGMTQDSGFNDGAMPAKMIYRNALITGSQIHMTFGCTGNYEAIYDTCVFIGIGDVLWKATGCQTQTVRNCVFFDPAWAGYIDNSAGMTYRIYDSYINNAASSQRLVGNASAASAGAYALRRNTIKTSRSIYCSTGCNATCVSAFNDLVPTYVRSSSYAYTDVTSTNFSALTSNSDYISGQLGALQVNVDTSESTTSTASPKQYKNLTATRTNAKSVMNKPLTIDNISISNITSSGATVSFDCANGAVSGQGSTTVNADSSAVQATLGVTSTTGFEVAELVEVGFGTARAEVLRVLSINAGVSLTFETNLAYAHTAVQADTVKKQLRHAALPYIEIGVASGVYQKGTALPEPDTWPLFYTGLRTSYDGMSFAFKKTGHSINLTCPLANTTYYIKCYGYNILGVALTSAETTFTTLAEATPTLAATFMG